jgi:type I restriction enzyme, R subunit
MSTQSSNFNFLASHDLQLVRFGTLAERYFKDDPSTSLIKLRQFGEVLAQLTAASSGQYTNPEDSQADLLRRLRFANILSQETNDLFHQLRIAGNRATHHGEGDHAQALASLKIARQLGIWFHRTFSDPRFIAGPFIPPPDPTAATTLLQAELDRLKAVLADTQTEAQRAQTAAEDAARQRMTAEEQAEQARKDREVWEQLAIETEQAKSSLIEQLQSLQTSAAATPNLTTTIVAKAEEASRHLDIDEATTRALIDTQLRAAGWEADTPTLRYSKGTRPVKNRNLAIAEWPTENGPADYALFVGTRCIAVVEAKRRNRNVSSHIDQAQRYARAFQFHGDAEPIDGPWNDTAGEPFEVPFVFSANGRPYLKQLETESGIWFRDARKPTNRRRALNDWYTPDGLEALLKIDAEAAHAQLKTEPVDFAFPLRPYQRDAIFGVESQLADDNRSMLLAMATGTGKTKLAIALLYRLINARRFRRVCFVVDRSALGNQANNEFKTTRIVSTKTFADIFGLKGLDDAKPDSDTRVHICTIQSLVKRVLYTDDPNNVPPVDQYDLIVVDECHRGYLLDREMSDDELSFRSQEDYISKYRRVLEHFDAVKIGLTATPALHTTDIFGPPIYTYSYRQAVVDGYLIDHEPPVQITTALSQSGITFEQGDEVEVIDTKTGQIAMAFMPDELNFKVDAFNRRVITKEWNRVVAEELANHIDPSLPGKTLIFAATDAHADLVVERLKQAFEEAHGAIEDAAVRKITGSVDRVNSVIRSFRNDEFPKIAVTVDLLTTGIDVPSITNLVFLRRVNSRILYEQMLGRATRRCDEIGKETFRIFDAVDLYRSLQKVTAMKPVVVNPNISFAQLWDELATVAEASQRDTVRDQILVKLRRRIKHMHDQARARYETEAGEPPETTLARFATEPTTASAAWVRARQQLGQILDWDPDGSISTPIPISHHADRVISVTTGYGSGQKPEDFLASFTAYIRDNVDTIDALTLVVQRPRDLTRAALRDLSLQLDGLGYSTAALRRAWTESRNEDIAASIIGFIRYAAIGDALIPFEDRVSAAMQRIRQSHPFNDVQRKWLKRIEDQLLKETVVDHDAIDAEPFRSLGGFQRLDKTFNGQLDAILIEINENIWKATA